MTMNLKNNSSSVVVDLKCAYMNSMNKPSITFKLVGILLCILLCVVVFAQVIVTFCLEINSENKVHMDSRHIHPEIKDIDLSRISNLVMGELGKKHNQLLQHFAEIPHSSPADDFDQIDACDDECIRFRDWMKIWPKEKPKGALVILTQIRRLYRLKSLLETVENNFLNTFQYPVIIFHENGFEPYIEKVRNFTKAEIFFQEIEFVLPDFINDTAVPEKVCQKGIGYRHMCRFFSKLIYNQPTISELEYMFRLDDDSLITSPITYDVFKYMKDNDKVYGYMWEIYDAWECTTGLWDAVREYIAEHSLQPTFFNDKEWPEPKIFYNNFEISKMELWNGLKYKYFVDYIDKLGGIYYHRWGDAPIKGLALSLFVRKEKLHRFKDIGYKHAAIENIP